MAVSPSVAALADADYQLWLRASRRLYKLQFTANWDADSSSCLTSAITIDTCLLNVALLTDSTVAVIHFDPPFRLVTVVLLTFMPRCRLQYTCHSYRRNCTDSVVGPKLTYHTLATFWKVPVVQMLRCCWKRNLIEIKQEEGLEGHGLMTFLGPSNVFIPLNGWICVHGVLD